MDETVTKRCGLKARKLAKGEHRPGSGRLTHKQAVRIRRLIIERMPDQLAMPFYLWTRESVAQLIKREDVITVSTWTAGRYLKSWGMVSRSRSAERTRETMPR
jgi:transposase